MKTQVLRGTGTEKNKHKMEGGISIMTATDIKTVCHWQKNRHTQSHRAGESPEEDLRK